jgi:formate hydrogenlyase transcriptional activator
MNSATVQNSNYRTSSEHNEFEKIISGISARFINIPWNRIDNEIEHALSEICNFIGFQRGTLVEINTQTNDFIPTHQFDKQGIPAFQSDIYKNDFPWVVKKEMTGDIIFISSPEELPAEAVMEKRFANKFGIKSHASIPLIMGGSLAGFLSLEAYENNISRTNEIINNLRLIGDIFSNAIARKIRESKIENLQAELTEKLKFEEMISGLSAKFIHIPWKEIDNEIENSLKDIVSFLQFERGNIMDLNEAKDDIVIVHQYPDPIKQKTGFKDILPWYISQILKGKTIIISSPEDFPPEAEKEIELTRHSPFQSTIDIPLLSGKTVIGALGFTTYSYNVNWNEGILKRLAFLSDIYANAIIRKKNEEQLEKFQEQLQTENILLREELKNEYDFENIIGNSDVIKYVFYKIKQVAPTNTTVLIEGETGVGKQLFAYAIHQMSKRNHLPLLKVNCAALPANLIESELFGHERGAFTGADKIAKGRFEIADGGTIFLDEIGELPLELQTKLLRVLQDGEFERLGSSKTFKTDVRIIAATNRKLKEEIEQGLFRKDLYYRLSAYPLTIPPLRERKEDIPLMVTHFANKFAAEMGKKVESISKLTMEKLTNYSWPGNVRELENIVERGVVTMKGNSLNIIEELENYRPINEKITTLEDRERDYIIKVLQLTEGKIYGEDGAANLLGINPSTLRARIKKLAISSKKTIS